jgi:DNA-damage-inducible protein D
VHPNSGEVARAANDGHESVFDKIKHVDARGEWWSARELMPLMGYSRWQVFEVPLNRAMKAAENTAMNVTSQFTRSRNVAPRSQGGGNAQDDYQLSRQAAYLVAMNGDPNKVEVAAAQAYFAARTHEAELAQQEHDALPDWAVQQIATIRRVGRLEVEQKMQGERLTAVESRVDGIQGRYDWYTALGYARLKGLPTAQGYLQRLGKLAANICRRDGIEPETAQDRRYGGVGSYPVAALDEAATHLSHAA